jgi:hypothetical protein
LPEVTIEHDLPRNLAQLDAQILGRGNNQGRWETTMERTPDKAAAMPRKEARVANKRDDRAERASLAACYGRIGIPAVAAALTPRHDERRPAGERGVMPWDRD